MPQSAHWSTLPVQNNPKPVKQFCLPCILFVILFWLSAAWSSAALAQATNTSVSVPVHIKDSLWHQSLKEVLAGVAILKEGKVGAIVQKFSEPEGVWRWIIKEGSLPAKTNALTENTREGVVTTLNYRQLKRATKLSVARTLIHEMIHAYLVLYFKHDATATKEYPRMVEAYRSAVPAPDLNEIHHSEMAFSFVGEIATALREYGRNLGLQVDDSVYTDLAWGGLDFRNNDQLGEECKLRIQRRLTAEQTDQPVFPQVQPVGSQMGD